jgi:hypothetical protein
MPSFAGKLELLLESYDQSKRTPAYKELNAKYKALKRTHAELLLVLTSMNHSNRARASEEDTIDATPSKQRKHRSLRKSRKDESNVIETFMETEDAEEEVVEVFVNNAEPALGISGRRYSVQPMGFAEEQPSESHTPKRSDDSGLDVPDENATKIQELLRLDEVVQVTELELDTQFASDIHLIQNDANIKYELPESPSESVTDQISAEIIAETAAGICDENEIDVDIEEVVEVEEDEVVEVEEDEETEEVEETEEEEEAGVYEIEINGTRYFTTNEQDGIVYEAVGEDDVGDEIGKFVKGKLVLL